MRRLDTAEENALKFVKRIGGSYCPSRDAIAEPFIIDTLNRLVRMKRMTVEPTDDGPRFHLTMLGEADA